MKNRKEWLKAKKHGFIGGLGVYSLVKRTGQLSNSKWWRGGK